MIVEIKKSNRKNKRYVAIFDDETKTHFGYDGGQTYLDHHDKIKRENYRKRHKNDLKTNDPKRAGYLSYYILWGEEKDLDSAKKAYNKKFF